MSSFDVEVLPEAEAEAREAFLWYFERSPIAADAFRVELFNAIDGLTDTAKDWPEDEDGARRYHLRHFPYTVMHELPGRNVTVFAIAHPSRRPGYWQDRWRTTDRPRPQCQSSACQELTTGNSCQRFAHRFSRYGCVVIGLTPKPPAIAESKVAA